MTTTGNKIHLISFGNTGRYDFSRQRLNKEAEQMGIFDTIHIYSEKDFDQDFMSKHGKFIEQNPRGYGYWLWKPYFIKKELELINDNDVLIYIDLGSTINHRVETKSLAISKLNGYIEMLRKSPYPILSHQLAYIEKNWNKMDLINHLDCNQKEILDSGQLSATINIMLKTEYTTMLVNKWYEIASTHHLIDDSPSILPNLPEFIEHRHDQSIWSLLRKKYGSVVISEEQSEYANSRLDNNLIRTHGTLNNPVISHSLVLRIVQPYCISNPFWATKLKF